MFVSHDERKVRWLIIAALCLCHTLILSSNLIRPFAVYVSQAVEELLAELDLDRKSIVVGTSRVRT